MAKKGSNQNRKKQLQAYKANGSYAKNKKAKLERHLKKFPEDSQAEEALNNVSQYSRKKPYGSVWSGPKRELAQMYRKAGLNGHLVIAKKEHKG